MIAEDGEETSHELVVLDEEHEPIAQLGLSLAEAKLLLRELQRQVLERQVAAFLGSRAACPACGRARGIKDYTSLRFRTLFGKLALASPTAASLPLRSAPAGGVQSLARVAAGAHRPGAALPGDAMGLARRLRADGQSPR
jgi:hypothetical protein